MGAECRSVFVCTANTYKIAVFILAGVEVYLFKWRVDQFTMQNVFVFRSRRPHGCHTAMEKKCSHIH